MCLMDFVRLRRDGWVLDVVGRVREIQVVFGISLDLELQP